MHRTVAEMGDHNALRPIPPIARHEAAALPREDMHYLNKIARAASSDLSADKYRRISFLRLGISASHDFLAAGLVPRAERNHGGIGCIGPLRYSDSNSPSNATRMPPIVID